MSALLSTTRPVLFMEVNYDSLAAAGSGPEELQRILHDLRLELTNWSITPILAIFV